VAKEVPKITVPALFFAAEGDSGFVDDTRTLYAACAATDKKLEITVGTAHGTNLLDALGTGTVRSFLKTH
jgi:dienelactone hydrolase